MIIRHESSTELHFYRQHDHGIISGTLATYLQDRLLPFPNAVRDQWLTAVRDHDIGWTELDEEILWDEEKPEPYQFEHYPALAKTRAYERGINQVEKQSILAGLLCSMHLSSFFEGATSLLPEERNFLNKEHQRQEQLYLQQPLTKDQLDASLHLLQFCDHLSLYICQNKPGSYKINEFPWYKEGFAYRSGALRNHPILGWWTDENRVVLHPFPFKSSVNVLMPYKRLEKEGLHPNNINDRFHRASVEYLTVQFAPIEEEDVWQKQF
ncbi:DUF3891 family protein [Bacillaceae bacterium SIJ1]|uniref:DUF3891 family protein n=1 Tax=Litoribacterium kuwaitense TaxID=1398745 RepID=UPI0013EBFDA1|nr:DUF3891 family protein [Litoribacterium kuwaitense]NGP43987.1 DUF3891 family protein [Litoribacterium kuwaitense]